MRFPLDDVGVKVAYGRKEVKSPLFNDGFYIVNQQECSLHVDGVGNFYASNGKKVEYSAEPDADPNWVNLYLYGQVLVALLHQRKIINFHASSFIYDGRGIMILGETGAGKSSLTVSFALAGAGFLSDDLTAVIFREGVPFIWPLSRRVKIREGTAAQLNIDSGKLADAEAGTGKKYLSLDPAGVENHALHTILKIETGDVAEPVFHEPSHAEKFSLLRSEICSWEILAGMPETEAAYLQQLVQIVEKVRFVRVVRPAEITIADFHSAVEKFLNTELHGV